MHGEEGLGVGAVGAFDIVGEYVTGTYGALDIVGEYVGDTNGAWERGDSKDH